MLLLSLLTHLLLDAQLDPSRDTLHVWDTIASPLLTAGEYLIPAGVALSIVRIENWSARSAGPRSGC